MEKWVAVEKRVTVGKIGHKKNVSLLENKSNLKNVSLLEKWVTLKKCVTLRNCIIGGNTGQTLKYLLQFVK